MDPVTGDPARRADTAAEMVLHEEQLRITTRRVPAERVRLVRRIVTETRMVPVEVRREVVDVERIPLDGDALTVDTTSTSAAPLVMVIREEYPQITLGIRAVEQITATVTRVTGQTVVHAEVSTEHVEVIDIPAVAPQV